MKKDLRKILLDENMPDGLAEALLSAGLDACGQRETPWAGMKNGFLSQMIAASSFTVFITKDRNFHHQGGLLSKRPATTIVLLDAKTLRQAAQAIFIKRFLCAVEAEGLPLEAGLHAWPKSDYNR